MNILLVEPEYRATLLPHGLLKIAAMHKDRKDNIRFVRGVMHQKTLFDSYKPDVIYITSLFTYMGKEVIKNVQAYKRMYPKAEVKVGGVFASLMPDYVEQQTGIRPHVGLLEEAERYRPDYSFFPEVDYCLTFTSRGCMRKCKFCAVSKMEVFHPMEKWKREIDKSKSKIIIQDNNFVANPADHQEMVVRYLAKLDHKPVVDINSGMDAIIFKEEHAKRYSKLNIQYARFAFDGLYQDGYVQRAITLAKQYKIGKQAAIIYVLYNFKDTPEDFYYRVHELYKLTEQGMAVTAYPMKYCPLDALDRTYVGEHWNKHMLRAVKETMQAFYKNSYISMSGQSRKDFEKIWGRSPEEFREKMAKADLNKLKGLKDNKARKKELEEDEDDDD